MRFPNIPPPRSDHQSDLQSIELCAQSLARHISRPLIEQNIVASIPDAAQARLVRKVERSCGRG